MNSDLKRFVFKIFIAAIVLFFLGWVVFNFITPEHYLPILPYILVFFVLVTVLLHAYQLRLAKNNFQKFVRYGMLISMFRLLVYTGVTIVYLATNSGNIAVFVVSIVIIYLVFSFIEVTDLSRITRNKNK
jgi:hypothetical protein